MNSLSDTFQNVAKYGALFGFGFYTFFFRSATIIKEQNPDADFIDLTVGFYEGMYDTVSETFLDGAGITLVAAFNMITDTVIPLVTDTIAPGVGTALSMASGLIFESTPNYY